MLIKQKENCLSINGKQSVILEKGVLILKIILNKKQFHLKFMLIFECNLRGVESYEASYTQKYQDHIPCIFAYKVVCVDDKFTNQIVVYRGKNAAY